MRAVWFVRRHCVAFALAWVGFLPHARASNGNLPRTPVIHQGETCMTVVNPATTPVLHLPYTIPHADTCLAPDELPDSRTHQFVAWCRTWPAWEQVPHWLTWSDVDRAIGNASLPQPPSATDVVEDQPALESCLVRIDADDERREIHCTTSIEGVDWDVSAVPAGAWVVHGYTFDPPANLWVKRRGVVKIEGAIDAPAAALAPHGTLLGSDAPLMLEACVDAPAGSTLRASWASASGSDWHVFSELDGVGDGTFAIELPIPDELTDSGATIVLRVEIVAPDGSMFAYDSPDEVTVIDAPVSTTGGSNEPFDFCVDNPSALDPQACTGGEDEDPEQGCGCTTAPAPAPIASLAMLLLLAGPLRGSCTRGRAPRCSSRGTTRTA